MSRVANLKRRQPAPSAPYQPAATGLPSPEVSCSFQPPLPMIRLLLADPRALKPALLLKTSNDVLLCLKIQPLQSPLTPLCFLIFLARPSFRAPTFAVFSCWVHFPGLSRVAAPLQPLPLASRPHRPVCLAARTGLPAAHLVPCSSPPASGIALGGALSLPGSRVPRTRCSAATQEVSNARLLIE